MAMFLVCIMRSHVQLQWGVLNGHVSSVHYEVTHSVTMRSSKRPCFMHYEVTRSVTMRSSKRPCSSLHYEVTRSVTMRSSKRPCSSAHYEVTRSGRNVFCESLDDVLWGETCVFEQTDLWERTWRTRPVAVFTPFHLSALLSSDGQWCGREAAAHWMKGPVQSCPATPDFDAQKHPCTAGLLAEKDRGVVWRWTYLDVLIFVVIDWTTHSWFGSVLSPLVAFDPEREKGSKRERERERESEWDLNLAHRSIHWGRLLQRTPWVFGNMLPWKSEAQWILTVIDRSPR